MAALRAFRTVPIRRFYQTEEVWKRRLGSDCFYVTSVFRLFAYSQNDTCEGLQISPTPNRFCTVTVPRLIYNRPEPSGPDPGNSFTPLSTDRMV